MSHFKRPFWLTGIGKFTKQFHLLQIRSISFALILSFQFAHIILYFLCCVSNQRFVLKYSNTNIRLETTTLKDIHRKFSTE